MTTLRSVAIRIVQRIKEFFCLHRYGGVPNEIYYNSEYYDKHCEICGKTITVKNSRNLNVK